MRLRTKFLAVMILVPSFCLLIFLYFAVSTFVADRTSSLLEAQLQLLNSAGILLQKVQPNEVEAQISALFSQDGFENLVVADRQGRIRNARDPKLKGMALHEVFGPSLSERLANQSAREGGFETPDREGKKILTSYLGMDINNESLALLLSQPRSAATRASILFVIKAMASFMALMSLAVLLSLWLANQLTGGITQLSMAMNAFGQGVNDAPIPPPREDEIGQMSQQFRLMRTQIQMLFLEREDKVKYETEMQLAGGLQRRFFPPLSFELGPVNISGYIEPANNAGGDWWYYFIHDSKFVFLIGDVTGHGLNSAMLTGVCRSAASFIEREFTTPAAAMRWLNHAIFESTRNELNMTCCICSLDMNTGELKWCNASHELPLIVPSATRDYSPVEFTFLDEVHGPRLGERADQDYQESVTKLEPGQGIFLYSDGLMDLENPNGKKLGDRGFLRSFGKGYQGGQSASDLMLRIKQIAVKHRMDRELVDDLSFLLMRWGKSA